MRVRFYTFAVMLCVLTGAITLWAALNPEGAARHPIFGLLSGAGWFALGILFLAHRRIRLEVDNARKALGLPRAEGDLSSSLSSVLREALRFNTASSAYDSQHAAIAGDLEQNLRRIAELAYREFSAKSVELSLFDEKSGLWGQALLLGEPGSLNSQSMLVQAANEGKRDLLHGISDSHVMAMPLSFAGTLFGALRVELWEGEKASKCDVEVLRRLAAQGAMMLVNARFTEELLRMRRTSEESVQAKTGFLANLSHEIRGPLGNMLNGVELASDGLCGALTEELKETLNMIKESGEHLLDLVNDVLDYAKVEAGKVTTRPVEIRVKEILEDLSMVIRGQAQAKKHKVVVEEIARDIGIVCDKRHARQMLVNLLTNAVKYTPEGGTITIGAKWIADRKVKISIADTGIGIPQSERSKVFGAFERIENQYTRGQVGTGLGMPLTRRLAEVNGGLCNFDSEDGKGSTFWLVLPGLVLEDVKEGKDETKQTEELLGRGENILIVEHDDEMYRIFERYLKHQQFEVSRAVTGVEVLSALRDKPIQAALVENDLPDLPGEEMVSAIRSSPSGVAVPIVLLSSKAFVFDIERFLKLGVDRCLSKPVPLSELAETVRRLIDEAKSLAGQGEAQASPL